jgi:sugar O-acyltransferase (sialic acid O-acetyltransferase NeuD family)
MKDKLLLIGAGGHCKAALDLLARTGKYEIAGIIDLKDKVGSRICGVPVIGTDKDLPGLRRAGIKYCFISIAGVGVSQLRKRLYGLAKKSGFNLPSLISPQSLVSPSTVLADGNYISAGVIINAGSRIGVNSIINTGAIVEHGCRIGDFVHVSPGAVLNGNVCVGDHSHIGAGSTIIENVTIGERTIIGAGSVVVKDIAKGVIAYGNPCRAHKKNA